MYHNKALELSPESSIIYKKIAEMYLKKYNDVEKAIGYLESVENTRIVKIVKDEYKKEKNKDIYN